MLSSHLFSNGISFAYKYNGQVVYLPSVNLMLTRPLSSRPSHLIQFI